MGQAIEKGSALEIAVHAIEGAILKQVPGYSDKTFTIELRRIVTEQEVRHEIDIWVRVELGQSYDAIFIFECKNWQEKVGKNEIVVFSAKIHATRAQRGFFVAKSFTSYAEAQARLDPRITLLRVTDLPEHDVPVPLNLHGVEVERLSAAAWFHDTDSPTGPRKEQVDLDTAVFCLHGELTSLKEWLNVWFEEESDRLMSSFHSERADEGPHELSFKESRQFAAGDVTLNGNSTDRIRLEGTIRVHVVRPRFVSYYEVENRGRALTYSPDLGGAKLKTTFAMLAKRGS